VCVCNKCTSLTETGMTVDNNWHWHTGTAVSNGLFNLKLSMPSNVKLRMF